MTRYNFHILYKCNRCNNIQNEKTLFCNNCGIKWFYKTTGFEIEENKENAKNN